MKLCRKCNQIKSLNTFLTITRRGKQVKKSECKECSKLRLRIWSRLNKDYCNKKVKSRALVNKIKAVELLGNKCNRCKNQYHLSAYDFHHIDVKEFEIANTLNRKWENILPELLKCILLCSNCHRYIHNEGKPPEAQTGEEQKDNKALQGFAGCTQAVRTCDS